MKKDESRAEPTTEADWWAVREQVMAEAERFRAAVPTLLATLAERWVVFREGVVSSVHGNEADAYASGLERFGHAGGHVVAFVQDHHVVELSGLELEDP